MRLRRVVRSRSYSLLDFRLELERRGLGPRSTNRQIRGWRRANPEVANEACTLAAKETR